jgi:hypothetical protein
VNRWLIITSLALFGWGGAELLAEPKIVSATVELGANDKYYIIINGTQIEVGPEGGSGGDTTSKHPIPAKLLKRVNVIAFKQRNTQGKVGGWFLLSYLVKVKLDNGAEKVIKSQDKKDVVLYTAGKKNPPQDEYGNSWKDFEYFPDVAKNWNLKPKYKRPVAGLNAKEPMHGRERQPFIQVTDDGKSKNANDTFYYRRRFELWGKKVKQIPPTPKPTKKPKPTKTRKPIPTATPRPATLTPTYSYTFTHTYSYTETPTFSPTLEPDIPTYTYSDTPLPTITLTPFIIDTPVPSEPPTEVPTEQATLPPTYTPTPKVLRAITLTPVPRYEMLLDFEMDYDSYLRTDGYVVLESSTEGVSRGKRSVKALFKLAEDVLGKGKADREWLPSFFVAFDTPKPLVRTDWRAYSWLKIDVTNPSKTGINAVLEVGDSKGYRYRYKAVGLEGGKLNYLKFDLLEMDAVRLDRSAINYLSFGLDLTGRTTAPIVYLDALRLE